MAPLKSTRSWTRIAQAYPPERAITALTERSPSFFASMGAQASSCGAGEDRPNHSKKAAEALMTFPTFVTYIPEIWLWLQGRCCAKVGAQACLGRQI